MSNTMAEPACTVCHKGPIGECECEPQRWPTSTTSWVRPEFVVVVTEEIPVTDEMRATMIAHPIARHVLDDGLLLSFYRAMAAVAPNPRNVPYGDYDKAMQRITELEAVLVDRDSRYLDELTTRDKQITELHSEGRRLFNLVLQRNQTIADRDREIVQLRAEREAWKYLYEVSVPSSDQRMVAADEAGSHPYHGPTKPVTDANGNVTGRESVPDPVHERAHGVIGDIMAGRVIRPARDQMEKALADAKVKDTTIPKPIRNIAPADPRRMGWMPA